MDSSSDVAQGSTTTVQLGESNLNQVANRLGVDTNDLLAANPQIQDPSKLKVGQDIHLPNQGKANSKGEADDGSLPAKGASQDLPKAPLGDSLAASAMKAQLGGAAFAPTGTHGGGDPGKLKNATALPPDEQAIEKAGGDAALKGYQQFKRAVAQVDKTVHDAVVSGKIKQFDDVTKKLMDHQKKSNPSQAERDEAAKLWSKFFELNKDPDVQAELLKRERTQQAP
jgi:LysM repeat protein